MTKNHTTVEFHIEPLESRDAPKTNVGGLISGGSGDASIMSGWGEYKQANDVDCSFGKVIHTVL